MRLGEMKLDEELIPHGGIQLRLFAAEYVHDLRSGMHSILVTHRRLCMLASGNIMVQNGDRRSCVRNLRHNAIEACVTKCWRTEEISDETSRKGRSSCVAEREVDPQMVLSTSTSEPIPHHEARTREV